MIFLNKKTDNNIEENREKVEQIYKDYSNKFLNELQCSVKNDEEYAKYKGYLS